MPANRNPNQLVVKASHVTFLLECPRCFWLQVHEQVEQVSTPPASIFSSLDKNVKALVNGRHTRELDPSGVLPEGTFYIPSRKEQLIKGVSHNGKHYIFRGEPDAYILSQNGNMEIVAVVDFKSGNPSDSKSLIYKRQLLLYGWLLTGKKQQPASLFPHYRPTLPLVALGYLSPVPESMRRLMDHISLFAIDFEITWETFPFNPAEAEELIQDIIRILSLPKPPESASSCEWCKYREWARQTGY